MHTPIKKLGQNFLDHPPSVDVMFRNLDLNPAVSEVLVEIGPGLGALTDKLVQFCQGGNSTLYAVDIDLRFIQRLKEIYASKERIELIHADILDWLPSFKPKKDIKIIGSLPYYISSPILHAIVKMQIQPSVCVLLIQKEVAQKICAQVPDSNYLSSFVQTFYETAMLKVVPRGAFRPTPEVDGAIIKLVKRKDAQISSTEIARYERFLHRAHNSPRKMLNKVFNKYQLELVQLDPTLRPQNVSFEKWASIFKELKL